MNSDYDEIRRREREDYRNEPQVEPGLQRAEESQRVEADERLRAAQAMFRANLLKGM